MFFEQLKKLCAEKGTSPSAVAVEIGKSKSAVTRWKNGQEPSFPDAVKISVILGVNVTDLVDDSGVPPVFQIFYDGYAEGAKDTLCKNNNKKPSTISDEGQRKIFEIVNQLTPENQDKLLELSLLYLSDQNKKKES